MPTIKCYQDYEVSVHRSTAGYYIGVFDPEEGPLCRISADYYPTREAAELALLNGFHHRMNAMENTFCNGCGDCRLHCCE